MKLAFVARETRAECLESFARPKTCQERRPIPISALFQLRHPRSTGLFPQVSSRFSKENNIKQNGASRSQKKTKEKNG
jgi:hypothetical protein